MIAQWKFSETSPPAGQTVASSQPVMNSANYASNGVATPLSDLIALTGVVIASGVQGDTLDIVGQISPDEGSTWIDSWRIPTIAAGSPQVAWGFACGEGETGMVSLGLGLTPAIAPNTVALGNWGSRMRLVMTTGPNATTSVPITCWLLGQKPDYSRQF